MEITFTVPGAPQGKARARTVRMKNGFTHSFTPEKTVLYENLIKLSYAEKSKGVSFKDKQALRMKIQAYYPIPKSTSKKQRELMLNGELKPTKKPDTDNIAKVVCDALNGVAYPDDAQITYLKVTKLYSDTPQIVVNISEDKEQVGY